MGTLLKFVLGFGGTLGFLYWLHFYAPATNTPFAPSETAPARTTMNQKPTTTPIDSSLQLDEAVFERLWAKDTLFPYSTPPCESWKECWRSDSLRSEYMLSKMLQQVRAGQLNQDVRQWLQRDSSLSEWEGRSLGYYECDTVNGQLFVRFQTHSDLGNRQYLYQFQDTGWCRLVYYEMDDDLVNLTDYLEDLNGDGYADYRIHHYPSAGSHIRDVYQIYVYRPDTQQMEAVAELLNPTFYTKEGLIRGFGYGPLNEVDLYTYRWNSYQLDTVEIIDQPYNDSLPIVRYYWVDGQRQKEIIDSVPSVYLKRGGVSDEALYGIEEND